MQAIDILQLGLGAAFLAKDKIEELLKEMERRGELSRSEAQKFVAQAKQRAQDERDALDARIEEKIRKRIDELGLATKADIEELKTLLRKD